MTAKRVLSVGQCGADHGGISYALRALGAEATPAATEAEALERLLEGAFNLVLVNRVFDADGGSGLDFIRRIKADEALRATPVMLVSNYADAQRRGRRGGRRAGLRQGVAGPAGDARQDKAVSGAEFDLIQPRFQWLEPHRRQGWDEAADRPHQQGKA